MRSAAATAACLLAACVLAAPAHASISPAQTIDGPSADVVGFDGAAMSEDGTGGIVYRKRVDGRVHVFAAQFAGGQWRAPQRVDAGQRFDSSWPAIGAGDGGRLVVTWVQENGQDSDRLFSATIDPGAKRFGPPVPVDLNVGEATDTQPSLAMSRGGQAYLVYRVTKDPTRNTSLPPGTVEGEYRLARYTGQLWSTLGFPLNRNAAAPVSRPTPENAPRVAVDAVGNGVVAWIERDDDFVDRVWARRVFGAQVGIPLLVSPQKVGDALLRAPADALSLDVTAFGQAAVAFRQRGARGGDPTRVQAAILPEASVADAARFGAARTVDGFAAGPPIAPGPPSIATTAGGVTLTAFSVGTSSLMIPATAKDVGATERLDVGTSADPGDPQIDLAENGAVAAALRSRQGGRGQLQVLERRADGVPGTSTLSTARGGAIVKFALAGSGLGDALIGWQQGSEAFAQIGVAGIDAPPQEFTVDTPADFIAGGRTLRLRWDPAINAVGPVTYAVTLADEEVADRLTRRYHDVRLSGLDDGVTRVQVIARDAQGQETSSIATTLKIDRRAPTVMLQRRKGRRLRVLVRDGAKGQVSGADYAATSVSWGDGRRAAGREGANAVTHTYRRAGSYRVTVSVQDVAGNQRRVVRRVRVR